MTSGNGKPLSARQQISQATRDGMLTEIIRKLQQLRADRSSWIDYDRGYNRAISDALASVRAFEGWKS